MMRTLPADLRQNAAPWTWAILIGLAAVPFTWLAMVEWKIAAAGIYPLVFLLTAWRWPHVALALIFASVPFQSDLSGGGAFAKFSIAELNLALVTPIYLFRALAGGGLLRLGAMTIPVLLYFGVCIYSSSVTWRGDTALVSLLQMALYMLVAVTIFAGLEPKLPRLRLCFQALALVALVLAVVVVVTRSNYILGLHKNGIGASLSAALVVVAELWFSEGRAGLKRFWAGALAVIAAGLLLTLSRGAWLGAASGLALILVLRKQYSLLWKGTLLLVPVLAISWLALPEESRQYAVDFDPNSYNISARYAMVDFANEQFREDPLLGVGVGLRKQYDATNLVMLTLAETGVLGLMSFASVFLAFGYMVWKARIRIPPAHPFFAFYAIGSALMLSKLMHGMVDHYWSRGAVMLAWAGAGIVVAVLQKTSPHGLRVSEGKRP